MSDELRRDAELAVGLPGQPTGADKMFVLADLSGTRRLAARLGAAYLALLDDTATLRESRDQLKHRLRRAAGDADALAVEYGQMTDHAEAWAVAKDFTDLANSIREGCGDA